MTKIPGQMKSRLIACGLYNNAKSEEDIIQNLKYAFDFYLDLGSGESYEAKHRPLLQAANALHDPQFNLMDKEEILNAAKEECLKRLNLSN